MIVLEIVLSSILGSIFLVSSVPKLRRPKGFVFTVLNYQVLPPTLSKIFALMVPPLEFFIGLSIFSGTAVRLDVIIMVLLLISYMLAVSINMARGRPLECNCFGSIRRQQIGWQLLLQDGSLVLTASVMASISQSWLGPESWSVFRLTGLASAGSAVPLSVCVGLALLIILLFTASGWRRKKLMSADTKHLTAGTFPEEGGSS
jgi:hypothetical protein